MKRILSLLLVLTTILSLLAGCGAGEKETAQAQETEAAAMETTAAPTLSPEEALYHSLSDRMKQAVDLGLVALSQLEDASRIVTVGEASEILQRAYVHRTGVESKMLNELMTSADYSGRNATRGWLAAVPGLTDLELLAGDKYENYGQWTAYMSQKGLENYEFMGDVCYALADRMKMSAFMVYPDGTTYSMLSIAAVADGAEAMAAMAEDPLYCPVESVLTYGFQVYDGTNGEKFLSLDENGKFNAFEALAAADVAECALRFYHYPNPAAIPEFAAPEEVGSYNTDIITADLLAKETDLPEASCQKLPAQWHGVVMEDMDWLGAYLHPDGMVYEYEIKAIKDAGFNFIGFHLDFSYLQEYILFSGGEPYADMVNSEDKGKFSVERLEQLDRVLALCMKYDIHLNLRASTVGNFYNSHEQNIAMLNGVNATKKMAELWAAIARRYADIPNEYLSFTVLSNPVFHVGNNVLTPPIEAIQAADPDRCLMVEIYGKASKPKALAEMGVALSYRFGEPYGILEHKEYYKWNMSLMQNAFRGQEVIESFTWPYGDLDGEKTLETGLWGGASCLKVMEIAEECGVGFMVSDFGVNLENSGSWGMMLPTSRYSDEAYRAMIADVLSAVENRGYGWCFAHWYGYFGIANSIPALQNVTYMQPEGYPIYIDTAMYGWFQELNGVA